MSLEWVIVHYIGKVCPYIYIVIEKQDTMLPLHTLLNQLTILQCLTVEQRLQKTVSFDSKALLVFNSMMLGQTAEEIKAECNLTDENYPKYERPIYNCILEVYGIKAKSYKDNLLTESYYAINETAYSSDEEKAKCLEQVFHQLKKNNIEQESTELLLELHKLHLGTPLQAVYSHLYEKYKNIREANNTAFKLFISLNKKLGSFLKNRNNIDLTRKLILDYKAIRQLNETAENNTLIAILNLCKLMLSTIGNQKQLLKEDNITEDELLKVCKHDIERLPLGVEQYFLQNIVTQIDLLQNKEELVSYNNSNHIESRHIRFTEPNNFSFPNEVYQQIEKDNKIAARVATLKNRKKKRANASFPLAMKYKINSFSFSGGSWSTQST